MASGAHNKLVTRAGEYFVAAELNKRGAYAVTFVLNMPKIDLVACNTDQSRTIHIKVSTKGPTSSTWQTDIREGRECRPPENPRDETEFWAFVDLGEKGSPPRYWITPCWWIRNDIYEVHKDFLYRNYGQRPITPDSKHHGINEKRLRDWKEKWEILGIFDGIF